MNTVNFKHNITSDYHMFFHQAGSCQMEGIVSLYNYITTYLVGILFTVTTALGFIILIHLHGRWHIKQFKIEKNLNELIYWVKYLQQWTHSTSLELVWTIIPTIILIAIAVPSFILLYSLDEIVDTQCVVKVIAYQWYWKYEYPVLNPITQDVINFSYLSYMLPLEDLTEEDNLRLLEVDTPLVLPTNVNSKLVITSKDVIHSFALPALGIKMDAIPGRLNQVTVHIFQSGTYYGQCSELCGVNHAFMPIVVNAVSFDVFENFIKEGAEVSQNQYLTPFLNMGHAQVLTTQYENIVWTNFLVLSPEELKEELTKFRNVRNEFLIRMDLTLDEGFLRKNEDPKYLYLVDNPNLFDFQKKANILTGMIFAIERDLLQVLNVDKFFEYGYMPENIKVVWETTEEPFFEKDIFKTPEKIVIGYNYLNTLSVISHFLEYHGDAAPDQRVNDSGLTVTNYDTLGNEKKEELHTKNEIIETLNKQTAAILDTTVPETVKPTETVAEPTPEEEKPVKKNDDDNGPSGPAASSSNADLYIGPRGSY